MLDLHSLQNLLSSVVEWIKWSANVYKRGHDSALVL